MLKSQTLIGAGEGHVDISCFVNKMLSNEQSESNKGKE